MEGSLGLAVFVLLFPLVAGALMLAFMMGGKGKPAASQDEIVALKEQKALQNTADK